MLQTKVAQVTRNGKFIQKGLRNLKVRYLKAFLLHALLKNVYQGNLQKGLKVT